jgi:SNF2 family DNA or RNA helicase
MMAFQTGVWSARYRQPVRVIGREGIWGRDLVTLWLMRDNLVVRRDADEIGDLSSGVQTSLGSETAVVAAARIADALSKDDILAPIESSLIPLPHQFHALARAISSDRMRFLLADEVGLGKTIEAGLILRELKLRGLVKRVLVVAPKGLVTQWVSEMHTHFNEEFRLVMAGDFAAYGRFAPGENLWRAFDQVVCPMDSVKPMDARRGWSQDEVAAHNRVRFEDLIAAGWDLVIVDEAHRLGGSTEQVARFKLGQGLAAATPYLLLLTATPHQGNTDSFWRLLTLLDEKAFPEPASVTRQRVREVVIRTEKRRAIDADGKPLFKPRHTRLEPIAWEPRHAPQRSLYEAVTGYVRSGYDRAIQERKSYLGFLVILMQRLVTSSTRAIRTALERRLEVLQSQPEQLTLFPTIAEDEWEELDGQEQLDTLLSARLTPLESERAEVAMLLEAARRTEATGADAKAEALLKWLYQLQREEGDPELKVLIFTEFVPTQAMLRDFLGGSGFSVACLNGSMDLDERQRVQTAFAGDVRILISTDAGGEGLNLQFAHVVINYDIPWNPMRLEQRIGRVDRIGQHHAVRAVNFVLHDTVEYRVREVLEEKLAVILAEFGVDKTGDVLDSGEAGALFDKLYTQAITEPDRLDRHVAELAERLRAEAAAARDAASLLSRGERLDAAGLQALLAHPLPFWVERMTVGHILAHGGAAEHQEGAWRLRWPDGAEMPRVVFSAREAEEHPTATHLTLDEPRVRELTRSLPRFVPGQAIPVVAVPGLPTGVSGYWSLWRIVLHASEIERQRIMPLFVHDDGRLLSPTARFVWDRLIDSEPITSDHLAGEAAAGVLAEMSRHAEEQGRAVWEELFQAHRQRLDRERVKGDQAFATRRQALERIGLANVRAHRLVKLTEEERSWRAALEEQQKVVPELLPIVLVRIEVGP